jgi:FdhD protein
MNHLGIESDKIIRRKRDGELEYQPDDLTIEEPLEIRIGRRTLATTMRTPGQDKELAAGFLISEGIIRSLKDIVKISRPGKARNRSNIISIELAGRANRPSELTKRFGTITSSCGICGKESIAAVQQNFPPVASHPEVRITVETLLGLPETLRKHQGDFARTGGIHAAAVFEMNGTLRIICEDIGRHNAVDKVIGKALLEGQLPLDRCVVLVSGRASFEIVQKALAAGIPIIASVSAPSNLAVNFCRQNNQTLIGFLRPPSFNLYSHVERVVLTTRKTRRQSAVATTRDRVVREENERI